MITLKNAAFYEGRLYLDGETVNFSKEYEDLLVKNGLGVTAELPIGNSLVTTDIIDSDNEDKFKAAQEVTDIVDGGELIIESLGSNDKPEEIEDNEDSAEVNCITEDNSVVEADQSIQLKMGRVKK